MLMVGMVGNFSPLGVGVSDPSVFENADLNWALHMLALSLLVAPTLPPTLRVPTPKLSCFRDFENVNKQYRYRTAKKIAQKAI